MRPVQPYGQPAPGASVSDKLDWCIQWINRICDASQEDSGTYADPFQVTNTTPTHTFNAQTATPAQTAEVLATWLQDTKKRGINRKAG
jgi:hypothetical protein